MCIKYARRMKLITCFMLFFALLYTKKCLSTIHVDCPHNRSDRYLWMQDRYTYICINLVLFFLFCVFLSSLLLLHCVPASIFHTVKWLWPCFQVSNTFYAHTNMRWPTFRGLSSFLLSVCLSECSNSIKSVYHIAVHRKTLSDFENSRWNIFCFWLKPPVNRS